MRSADQFDAAMEAAAQRSPRVYLFLTGDKDATGASWCPDCNAVLPALQKALEKEREGELVVMSVVKAEYRGNPEYPLRKHKAVRLTTVPTFGRWEKGRLDMRLEEAQIADAELLSEVLAK